MKTKESLTSVSQILAACFKLEQNETKLKISIEAGSSDCWKKYVGDFGMTFGIDVFGKSAPFKDIYKHFGLIPSNIVGRLKKVIEK